MSSPDRVHGPLFELTRVRIREFLREPEAIFWVFAFPLLLALGLGIAFKNRPLEAIRVAVENRGPGAERLAQQLDASPSVSARLLPPDSAHDELRTGKIALVVVPGDTVTYVFDPTRDESRLARVQVDALLQRAAGRKDPRPVEERHLMEPGSRYIDFLIPGLLAMNLMGAGMWGVGFPLVESRRRRLTKRFLATPMRKSHYLLAFIFSRLAFVLVETALLVGFGWLVFDVRVYGSILTLGLVALLGSLTFSGLGLLTASRARTIEGISGLLNVVMLPMWIFSGVFFSYSRFPDALQPFIRLLPLTPLTDALRAIMTEGASLFQILPRIGLLAAWALVTFGAALKIFRWE